MADVGMSVECIAVDWSGALTGAASRIWMASARDGALTALTAPGSRDAVREALLARRGDATPCLVGLDFAFSMPAWFLASRGWRRVEDLWAAARDEGETWLTECAAPFWGRPGASRPHDAARGLRATERAWSAAQKPKSVFQIGGAGSVGTGSVRGMPMLLALRGAAWAVWPFDAPSSHTLVEIYPRIFTGPVVKSSVESRTAHLVDSSTPIAAEFVDAMIASEDAFDAGLAAIGMSDGIARAPLTDVSDPTARIEGAIWVPGRS